MELQKKWSETFKLDILGEYKRRSEKCIFSVTTKMMTIFNKSKSNVPINQLGYNSKLNKTVI